MPSSYSWPLISPPSPGATPGTTSEGAAALLSTVSGRPQRGLIAPFTRGANDFTTGEGAALINSGIRQVLGTRCSSSTTQGEIPWLTEFGSLLDHARHRNNDAVLGELLNQWTVDAIARWMKSVRITQTKLIRTNVVGEENEVHLQVWWTFVSRGGQHLGSGSTSIALSAIGRA